jgi:hypothetical protein
MVSYTYDALDDSLTLDTQGEATPAEIVKRLGALLNVRYIVWGNSSGGKQTVEEVGADGKHTNVLEVTAHNDRGMALVHALEHLQSDYKSLLALTAAQEAELAGLRLMAQETKKLLASALTHGERSATLMQENAVFRQLLKVPKGESLYQAAKNIALDLPPEGLVSDDD